MSNRIWKYGDGVDTDVIFPGKYTYTLKEPAEIAAHALEDLDARFAKESQPGDVIVAGRNWGNGSSREQAVTTLKYRGIAAVIARSFGRIYYRNAVNQGLLLLTCPEVVDAAGDGDALSIDLTASTITTGGRTFAFQPLSPSVLSMIEAGGLVPHLRKKLGLSATGDVKIAD